MCLRLNTSAGAMPASITVQRAALFAGAAMSKAHVTGRANTWSGATMINRRLLIYGAPKAATESGGNTPVPGEMKGDLTIANGIAGVQIWGYSAYHDVGDLKPHEFRYSGSPATFNVTALYVDEMYIGTVLLDWPLTPQPGSIKITLNGEISFTLPFRNNAENNSAYGGFTSNEIASWFVDHNHQLVDCVMEFV